MGFRGTGGAPARGRGEETDFGSRARAGPGDRRKGLLAPPDPTVLLPGSPETARGGRKSGRSTKLVDRRLQLRLTGWFLVLSSLTMVFQFLLFTSVASKVALEPHSDPAAIYAAFSAACVRVLWISALVVLPATLLVGVLTTFRIAGPVYRLKAFLDAIRRGESPPDVQIRKGDELQDVCELLNEVTRPLRREADVREPVGEREAA